MRRLFFLAVMCFSAVSLTEKVGPKTGTASTFAEPRTVPGRPPTQYSYAHARMAVTSTKFTTGKVTPTYLLFFHAVGYTHAHCMARRKRLRSLYRASTLPGRGPPRRSVPDEEGASVRSTKYDVFR